MEFAGPTVRGKATAHRLRTLVNHRKLAAAMFPWSASEEMTDAAGVTIQDQKEMFHCAASQGILSIVLELLADQRFSCDLSDRFGRTPLHWAAEQGHHNVVLALLRARVRVDPRSKCKSTPILLAASRGHVKIVGLLLQYRAGQSDCLHLNRHRHGIGHSRSTALHCAAAGGHVKMVEILLDAGFDKGQRDGTGLTPAEVSARQLHSTSPAVTHLLLPTNDMGGKLLYDYVNMAIQDVAVVSGLVKGGAFLDWQDTIGDSPLQGAVCFDHVGILRILLRAGADPNLSDHLGSCPLHAAACTGCEEMIADLLEAGADTELTTVWGESPLHLAVMENREDVVDLLLNAGSSTESCDAIHGQTPLSWACRGGLAPIVRVLVEAGADVESRSSAGLTPLHWACRFIDAESVEVLLDAGADPGVVDQAAANDAMAASSSRSGTIVSRPVAMDVVGLGYPLVEDSRCPFRDDPERLAARRLDLGLVQHIERALDFATRKHTWGRRGWLVILANRRIAVKVLGVRGERAAVCRVDRSPFHQGVIQLPHVDTDAEQPPCVHQKGAAGFRVDAKTPSDGADAQHPQDELSNRQNDVEKRLRSVDDVSMAVRATSRQKDQRRGDIGGQNELLLPELVAALLELAAVEVGLFRGVMMFI